MYEVNQLLFHQIKMLIFYQLDIVQLKMSGSNTEAISKVKEDFRYFPLLWTRVANTNKFQVTVHKAFDFTKSSVPSRI